MAGLRATFDQAVTRHRTAAHRLAAVKAVVESSAQPPPDQALVAAENQLAQRLSAAAAGLAEQPGLVRLGIARLHRSGFPVHVPFLGAGHLTLSVDARDPRVAGLLRGILLHSIATAPAGTVEVVTIDTATVGAAVAPLQPLVDARVMTPAATDTAGVNAALAAAEDHVKTALRDRIGTDLVLFIPSAPDLNQQQRSRLEALAHAGIAARLHILAAGVDELPDATAVTVEEDMRVGHPPTGPWGPGPGLAMPVAFETPPDDAWLRSESRRLADRAKAAAVLRFVDLAPTELWTGDPGEAVSTIAGRDAHGIVELSFDDTTPHWLIGGRTGGGKTVFLLDIMYGLAARYAPTDLSLYLLDFKEGVSFTEFTPQPSDPSYIPHAAVVGVESDREYGVAILRELDAEMTRRSVVMKQQGVARYAQLARDGRPPRIVCVIDEFQVLFAGNDRLAKEAVALLENLARKGRSYGVHLVLASQTTSGIEALYNKRDSIFGQFPLRVALPGANAVLDPTNNAAAGLTTGEAVVNTDGGAPGRDRRIRFPNAHAEAAALHQLRHDLWQRRDPRVPEPTVFYGYAAVHLDDDPVHRSLTVDDTPRVLLGRKVDAGLSTAGLTLDPTPGRHLSILGSDPAGGELLHAAATSLVRQQPQARYLVCATAAGELAADLVANTPAATPVPPAELGAALAELADTPGPAFLVGFGLDAAGLDRDGQTALRTVLRTGPSRGVHLLGWWRVLRRFVDDLGMGGKEDVSCSVVLNIAGNDLLGHFGPSVSDWDPRPGRALLVDRHANTTELLVPFTRREDR